MNCGFVADFGRRSPHISASEIEIAYAAGFFDGEGNITIAVNKGHKSTHNPVYNMRIGAAQVDPAPLFWLRDRWGGSVQPVRRLTSRHNQTFIWGCFSRNAEKFLKCLLPHLIVKRARAEIALAFQATILQPGRRGHTDGYREKLALFKLQMNSLNGHRSTGVPQ